MKDFIRVFILLVMVMASLSLVVFLGYVLGYVGMSLLAIFISTVIILLFIKYFPSRGDKNRDRRF